MKWQTKAYILRQLSQMPMGKHLYLFLQKLAGSNRAHPQRDFARILELLEMIKESGQRTQDATFFEIGTGWHPYTPLGCYLAGAEKIITVDVNPWMSLRSAKETVITAKDHLPWIAEAAGIPEATVFDRYNKIDLNASKLETLLAIRKLPQRKRRATRSTPRSQRSNLRDSQRTVFTNSCSNNCG